MARYYVSRAARSSKLESRNIMLSSSWSMNHLEKYTKSNMLQEHVLNATAPEHICLYIGLRIVHSNIYKQNKTRATRWKTFKAEGPLDCINKSIIPSQQLRGNKSAIKTIHNNLIHVKKSNSNSPSAKFPVWNAQSIRERRKASAIIDLVVSIRTFGYFTNN